MTIHSRVKEVRKALNMPQDEFGERIGIKKSSISQIESGKTNPSDLTVRAICREFRVNEDWLRTGEGEMFSQLTTEEELMAFVTDLTTEGDTFRTRLVSALSRLTPEEWKLFEKVCLQAAEDFKKEKGDP